MMCFIGHNYNSPLDPTVYDRLRELYISRHDWRGCRGERKLPRRSGDIDKGSEEVNQSDTVI